MIQNALDAASHLQPDAGEVHLARALYLFRINRDYAGALRELQLAVETFPNSPKRFELIGSILRRQGHLEESLHNFKRALELDPRNISTLQQIAMADYLLRRYSDVAAALDRALTIKPDDVETQVTRASVELSWKGDTGLMDQVIDSIRKNDPAKLPSIADTWFVSALAERNPNDAETALVALGDGTFGTNSVQFNRSFGEGLLARMIKDDAKAYAAFMAARLEQEKVVKAQPDYGPAWCILGLIDAGLGRKEEALHEGRRAIELLSVEKDAINGANMIEYFAITAAWVGEKELACEQLEMAERLPSGWFSSYGLLKLSPVWDSLRGYPRFEKIITSLAPKS
jgi:serine/threonine-protein kinase